MLYVILRLNFENRPKKRLTKTKRQKKVQMVARDFKTRVLPVSKKLLRFATHFLKNEDEAKDVVQEVFLIFAKPHIVIQGLKCKLRIIPGHFNIAFFQVGFGH